MKDFIERLKNWKTTILGFATLIIILLVSTGVIGEQAKDFITQNLGGFWEGIMGMLSAISGIVLILSKYPDK